jgi:hypothetical protein
MTIRLTQRSSRKIIGRSTTVISPKNFDRIVKLPYSSITQPLEGKGGTVAVIDPVDLSAPIIGTPPLQKNVGIENLSN